MEGAAGPDHRLWVRVGPTLPAALRHGLSLRLEHPVLVLLAQATAEGSFSPVQPSVALPPAPPGIHIHTASALEALDAVGGRGLSTDAVPVLFRLSAVDGAVVDWRALRRGLGSDDVRPCDLTGQPTDARAHPRPASLLDTSIAVLTAPAGSSGGATARAPPKSAATTPMSTTTPEWPLMLDDCHVRDLFGHPVCGRFLGQRGGAAYALVTALTLGVMLGTLALTAPHAASVKTHPD